MNAENNLQIDEVSNKRLWKALDDISSRLISMEQQLVEVVRVQEQVKTHGHTLDRYGTKLDSHDKRIRETELWQANHGDKASLERLVANLQEDSDQFKVDMHSRLESIVKEKSIDKGQKDVALGVFKWLAGILAAFILLIISGGEGP